MQMLPKDPIGRKYMSLGFKIVGDFGATIAIPVVVFVIIAQKLESKYGGAPWLTVIAFVLAALLTGYMINKKAKEYGQEYKKLGDSKKQEIEKIVTRPDRRGRVPTVAVESRPSRSRILDCRKSGDPRLSQIGRSSIVANREILDCHKSG